ncbi:adenine phosphoribosyltransferase [Coemansia sp. RSA 2523]|nr:adenine phosphoribosyltransferase [Coemansia sp. RSA 1752]KAJ1786693.1 adenine phosphoribosyltransferase [Coemansia sp. RSA 1938]KAJ1788364.1 adenine phosphoribosyltransferase [Coemansia sp. RSA 2167]KAJ1811272.1 adenine phosphoribosyltransferase [Coemansia sp. RSA 2523]KAJ2128298.1 adenine phosphoribosyltransferase [Coemansia sp. RSA 788]KAJ2137821.1 adenine phosphoribosyltransferase [Coemansia sp. RSA 678]KAJ2148325.1 adenine phosphoribosyltransferase [Coemansia sp. RSA 564]KAJ2166916.1
MPYTIEQVKALVREYPDFPSTGILFRDIFPIFQEPEAVSCLVSHFVERIRTFGQVDVVVGLDARGFLFGPQIAQQLGVAFVPVRKGGKLPGSVNRVTYEKEYGADVFEMQQDGVQKGQRVVIVDDLLATGGSCRAGEELVAKAGAHVVLNAFVIALVGLEGEKQLKAPVYALIEC